MKHKKNIDSRYTTRLSEMIYMKAVIDFFKMQGINKIIEISLSARRNSLHKTCLTDSYLAKPQIKNVGFGKCCNKVELFIVKAIYQAFYNHTTVTSFSGR